MKIRVLSDLHLEFSDWQPPPVSADVVVLAGDIHMGAAGLEWARRRFGQTPLIYVPGNHEFYDGELGEVLAAMRRAAAELGIHLLACDEIMLGSVRFLGATLWTDFELYGSTPREVAQAMATAQQSVIDYRTIRHRGCRLRPGDTRDLHRATVRWLEERLAEPHAGATVVVTHHLPHRRSVHPRHARSPLNPAFASDLAHLVRGPASLWIHGHTHESMDYCVAGTRVVCNPRGYLPHEPNRAFDPALLVELPG